MNILTLLIRARILVLEAAGAGLIVGALFTRSTFAGLVGLGAAFILKSLDLALEKTPGDAP